MPRATYRKKIVTDELTSQIDAGNIKLMERFLKEKNTRSSDTTVSGYRSDLLIFFCWNVIENENKFFIDIRKIEFSDFFAYVTTELKWQSARFSRLRACLSSFSNFIEKYYDDVYPNFRNVILKSVENMPKSATREKTVLSDEQIDKLKEHLTDNEMFQELCLLSLAIGSGARINELLRFKTSDIDENNTVFDGLFIKTLSQIKTKGRTKTGKLLYKFILKSEFMDNYKKWIAVRSKIMESKGVEHDFIFIDRNGNPATEGVIRGWSQKWEEFLGVPIYFHAFRHYMVTKLSKLGLSPDFIQNVVGWASVELVATYDDSNFEDKEFKNLDKLKENIE